MMTQPPLNIYLFGREAQVGKDTACLYLEKNHAFSKFAFADKLKNVVKDLYHFNHDQMHGDLKDVIDPRYNLTPRQVLQNFGNEQRVRYLDIWADYVYNEIYSEYITKCISHSCVNVCVSDFRFRNEYACGLKWKEKIERETSAIVNIIPCEIFRENKKEISGKGDISEIDLVNFTPWKVKINNNKSIGDFYETLRIALNI